MIFIKSRKNSFFRWKNFLFHSFFCQVQFTEGLLEVVIHKMKQTVRSLLDDERIFSHFVDETLIFDQEFRNGYSYQTENNDCLNVLSQPPIFKKWIALEKKCKSMNLGWLLYNCKLLGHTQISNIDLSINLSRKVFSRPELQREGIIPFCRGIQSRQNNDFIVC